MKLSEVFDYLTPLIQEYFIQSTGLTVSLLFLALGLCATWIVLRRK